MSVGIGFAREFYLCDMLSNMSRPGLLLTLDCTCLQMMQTFKQTEPLETEPADGHQHHVNAALLALTGIHVSYSAHLGTDEKSTLHEAAADGRFTLRSLLPVLMHM